MTKNVHFQANRKKGTFQLAETIQKGTEIAETDMIKSREHETKTSVDELSGVTTSSMAWWGLDVATPTSSFCKHGSIHDMHCVDVSS